MSDGSAVRVTEGHLEAGGLRFGIAVSRFNEFICSRLLDGALDALRRHGADEGSIEVARCPGAFELPLVVKRMLATGRHDAVVALGAVIRGSTPHFDFIAAEVTKGLAQVSLEAGVPVAYGVITTDTIEQAIERAGTKAGNKGWEAAMSAIEMADLLRKLPGADG